MAGSLTSGVTGTQTVRALVAAAVLSVSSQAAHASTNTTLTMIETPLQTLQSSLQGPVALAIGVIAMALTGGMLIFGGELSDFGKRSAYVVLVLGVLLTANTLVHALFTSATATIF